MSQDLRLLTTELKSLVSQLKSRCIEAEAHVSDLQRQVRDQQDSISLLQQQLSEMNTKYQNLQLGLAATGNQPEQAAKLREQYLAMVSEIDACIAKLQY